MLINFGTCNFDNNGTAILPCAYKQFYYVALTPTSGEPGHAVVNKTLTSFHKTVYGGNFAEYFTLGF